MPWLRENRNCIGTKCFVFIVTTA